MERDAGLSRRDLLRLAAAAAGLVVVRGPAAQAALPGPGAPPADEVLQRLLEGNQRFVKGEAAGPRRRPDDFRPLAEGQRPLAVIVGCADSRVTPELLFDQGIGDLFVVRVAGNVVSGAGPLVKGSIEYGVADLGVSLVMVLGHTECGAVKAAIQHMNDREPLPGALGLLVNSIRPAVAKTKGMPGDPLDNAIRANVGIGVEQLRSLQPIVAPAVKRGRVKVVGAVYDLRTGGVTLTV
ncbi:MAG: carbonic anhydrase [Candidatus Rokubacteria bacterium]|nr:carbonic anhydrase [Candidatus Rokubacteria bacterium]